MLSKEEKRSIHNYNEMLKRNHMCTRCHKQDAYTLGGRSLCAECAMRLRERGKKSYLRHRNEIRAHRNEIYSQAKTAGICPRCGKKKDWFAEGVLCYNCRKKDARRKHKQKLLQGANFPRGENGFCWMCNKEPALPDERLCQRCKDICVDNLMKGKPSTNSNHIWRFKNNNIYTLLNDKFSEVHNEADN